ncbi:hypothetical protein QQ045_010355 [Rhodiola kirilowii]
MTSWVRSITSPFKKACSFFNYQQKDKKSQQGHEIQRTNMDLQGEVMACGYEDVQVMWSILDKSKTTNCNLSH